MIIFRAIAWLVIGNLIFESMAFEGWIIWLFCGAVLFELDRHKVVESTKAK